MRFNKKKPKNDKEIRVQKENDFSKKYLQDKEIKQPICHSWEKEMEKIEDA
jgi:hypothetical protein